MRERSKLSPLPLFFLKHFSYQQARTTKKRKHIENINQSEKKRKGKPSKTKLLKTCVSKSSASSLREDHIDDITTLQVQKLRCSLWHNLFSTTKKPECRFFNFVVLCVSGEHIFKLRCRSNLELHYLSRSPLKFQLEGCAVTRTRTFSVLHPLLLSVRSRHAIDTRRLRRVRVLPRRPAERGTARDAGHGHGGKSSRRFSVLVPFWVQPLGFRKLENLQNQSRKQVESKPSKTEQVRVERRAG